MASNLSQNNTNRTKHLGGQWNVSLRVSKNKRQKREAKGYSRQKEDLNCILLFLKTHWKKRSEGTDRLAFSSNGFEQEMRRKQLRSSQSMEGSLAAVTVLNGDSVIVFRDIVYLAYSYLLAQVPNCFQQHHIFALPRKWRRWLQQKQVSKQANSSRKFRPREKLNNHIYQVWNELEKGPENKLKSALRSMQDQPLGTVLGSAYSSYILTLTISGKHTKLILHQSQGNLILVLKV